MRWMFGRHIQVEQHGHRRQQDNTLSHMSDQAYQGQSARLVPVVVLLFLSFYKY